MKRFLIYLLNLVLPPRCPYCGRIVTTPQSVCELCFKQLHFISDPYCHICGMPFETPQETINHFLCPECIHHKSILRFQRSALRYDSFSKKIILDFKFYHKICYAPILTKWLYTAGADIFKEGVDMIMPVPLSYRRFWKRGYNQSAILARMLSKKTGIPSDVTSLKKIKHTKPQSLLSENARLKNIKNAFQVAQNKNIKGKRVVLIDDVMTTGATLTECAKVLLKAGALSVDALTIARVIKE